MYKISIKDPDEEFLKQKELILIHNPDEWEYWVRKEHYPPPPNNDFHQIRIVEKKILKGDKKE